ncbi:MAG: helix-hairpin-helix domain-containing protein [Candidatus Eisenbacteria bacterium]
MGPRRRRLLLRQFGSVAAIKLATESDIAAVTGIGPKLAKVLKEALDEP